MVVRTGTGVTLRPQPARAWYTTLTLRVAWKAQLHLPGGMVGADSPMQGTRQAILDYLQREGRGTVRELAAFLGITLVGVRQHLAVLQRDGLVQARQEPGRVGRPALIYALTPKGEALYPKTYDTLANMLMEEIRAIAGAEALQRVLRRISQRMAEQRMDRVEGKSLAERVDETAQIMREMGCIAECERQGEEFYLSMYQCPYPNVARRNSGVCALEVDFVRRLTGADARLVASVLRGDRACILRIRPRDSAATLRAPQASSRPATGRACPPGTGPTAG